MLSLQVKHPSATDIMPDYSVTISSECRGAANSDSPWPAGTFPAPSSPKEDDPMGMDNEIPGGSISILQYKNRARGPANFHN